MHACMQDRRNIYLLLDYMVGGELFNILQRQPRRRLIESHARFVFGVLL